MLLSRSVVSDSLQPHGLQHARLPCPLLSHGVCSNSCPLSWWCHPSIASFASLFSCFQSFPPSGSVPMSQLFACSGQSIGVSASAPVLLMNIQDWFPMGLLVGSPCSPRDSQESSPTLQFKSINSLMLSFFYSPTLTSLHEYWKDHNWLYGPLLAVEVCVLYYFTLVIPTVCSPVTGSGTRNTRIWPVICDSHHWFHSIWELFILLYP